MVKITSLNLQGFDHWDERKPAILDYLRTESPDVILFQEVVYLPELSPYNPAQLLGADLSYTYEQSAVSRLQVGLEYPVYREGLALLSRYPVVKSDVLVLKQDTRDHHQRIVQLVDIKIGERIVKLANVHFSITDDYDFATPQLIELLDTLKARGEQRIIAGDFNLDRLEDSEAIWGDQYLASTRFDYLSFPSWNKRNDYFLIPKGYTFETFASSGDGLSDHRGLTATLSLPKSDDWRHTLERRIAAPAATN